MRFDKIVSREFLAVAGCGLAGGFLLGVGLASFIYIERATTLSDGAKRLSARVAMLESLVASPPDFAALDLPRASQQEAGAAMASSTSQMATNRPRVMPVRPGPTQDAEPARTPASPVQAQATRQMPPSQGPAPEAVTTEEIAAVVASSKVEGVPADKARVAKVSPEGVLLSSGKLIRPGERFSSGEKLLQVDPANNRVITSERQLLLFFGN